MLPGIGPKHKRGVQFYGKNFKSFISGNHIFMQCFVKFDKNAYAEYSSMTGTTDVPPGFGPAEASVGSFKNIHFSIRIEVVK